MREKRFRHIATKSRTSRFESQLMKLNINLFDLIKLYYSQSNTRKVFSLKFTPPPCVKNIWKLHNIIQHNWTMIGHKNIELSNLRVIRKSYSSYCILFMRWNNEHKSRRVEIRKFIHFLMYIWRWVNLNEK